MLEDAPFDLLDPGRRLAGLAPVLVPSTEDGDVDWDGFAHLLGRAADSSLVPAVLLDVVGAGALSPDQQRDVLLTTAAGLGDAPFAAAVLVDDDGGGFRPERHAAAVDAVASAGAVPILAPTADTAGLSWDEVVGYHHWAGDWCDRYLAVEAAPERWAHGRPWPLDVFAALLEVEACVGVVHRTWSRAAEWDRLRRRDDERPSFQVFSANDRALDQVLYGSDHLTGLAAAVPDALSARDERFRLDDPGFVEANDALQALATLVFRPPIEAAPHSLARLLVLRGWLDHDRLHPSLPRRADGEDDLLAPALERVAELGLLESDEVPAEVVAEDPIARPADPPPADGLAVPDTKPGSLAARLWRKAGGG